MLQAMAMKKSPSSNTLKSIQNVIVILNALLNILLGRAHRTIGLMNTGRTQALHRKCGCRAAFFPRKMEENYKVCDFYQHAFCIAEEIINFDYDICTGKEFSGLFPSRLGFNSSVFKYCSGDFNVDFWAFCFPRSKFIEIE